MFLIIYFLYFLQCLHRVFVKCDHFTCISRKSLFTLIAFCRLLLYNVAIQKKTAEVYDASEFTYTFDVLRRQKQPGGYRPQSNKGRL